MANGYLSPSAFEPQSQSKLPVFRSRVAAMETSEDEPRSCRLLWSGAGLGTLGLRVGMRLDIGLERH